MTREHRLVLSLDEIDEMASSVELSGRSYMDVRREIVAAKLREVWNARGAVDLAKMDAILCPTVAAPYVRRSMRRFGRWIDDHTREDARVEFHGELGRAIYSIGSISSTGLRSIRNVHEKDLRCGDYRS